MKILNNNMYLLLIDEEAEIKEGDYYLDGTNRLFTPEHNFFVISSFNKVIAYRPRTEEAKELDLPWLPNPFKDELKELINKFNANYNRRGEYYLGLVDGAKLAYKAAQSKQFSLEDMKKAIRMAKKGYDEFEENGFLRHCFDFSETEIIQSLSTQQLPKEFIHEYTYDPTSCLCDKKPCKCRMKVLKTITNSKGKKELVGVWVFEK